jgi:hypothetical protein
MITITSTQAAKIYFKGTTVEINSVVARLEFYAPKDGKQIQVAPYYYENEDAYTSGNPILSIEGVDGFVTSAKYYELGLGTTPETYSPQTIQVAHDKIKQDLENLGYTVTINGL